MLKKLLGMLSGSPGASPMSAQDAARARAAARAAVAVGHPEFGAPRISDGHKPGGTPLQCLRTVWPALYGIAAHAITAARQMLDLPLAPAIVMESAVPMSKIDLAAS